MDINEIVAQYMNLMDQYADMKPYTDEWWQTIENSLIFLPEAYRGGFMYGITISGCVF